MVKEAKIKEFLLKESFQKRDFDKQVQIHNYLFKQAETDEAKPMARQSGGTALKHSGWNTSWQFIDPTKDIERVKKQVGQKADKFFRSLQGQQNQYISQTSDLIPNPLTFKFGYFRTILPENSSESNDKALKALDVLDKILPGFKQFSSDLQKYNIPLSPYYMTENPSTSNGRVTHEQLEGYIGREAGKVLNLPNGQKIPAASHFRPHKEKLHNGDKVLISLSRNHQNRIYPIEIVDSINDSSELVRAIEYRRTLGYSFNEKSIKRLQQSLLKLRNQMLAKQKLDVKTKDPKQIDKIREIDMLLVREVLNRILSWWNEGRAEDIPLLLLREVLKNMEYTGGDIPDVPPNEFIIPAKRVVYYSNGWDSAPNDPNESMPVVPPLRGLPDTKNGVGEVRPDRGNGNLSYDHLVLNWRDGFDKIFQVYGAKADEWLRTMQNSAAMNNVLRSSPEVYAAWQLIISFQTGNRTSAENLLDVISRWPDWRKFYSNHLHKSFYSEITSVNELLKRPVASKTFVPNIPLPQQIEQHVNTISQLAQHNPVQASEMLKNLSAELVQLYHQGAINWDNLTLALNALNKPARLNRAIEGNGLTSPRTNESLNMIDENGFHILKQYGYQVAKMMDFLRAVMTRCCQEVEVSRPDRQQETFFGHLYGTSSGVSEGGDIILSITYDSLNAQVINPREVMVEEKITFLLGQRTGKNENDVIISRKSNSWETTLNSFNAMYPEAGFQFSEMNENVHRNLQVLELAVKEAINQVRPKQIQVTYKNTEGQSYTLLAEDLALENATTKQEKQPETPKPQTPLIQPQQQQTTPISLETEDQEWKPNPPPEEIENSILNPPVPSIPQKSKSMPDVNFVGKRRNNDRRLIRSQPNQSFGSIKERLEKIAIKFNNYNEHTIANKINLLLEKIN